MKEITFQISKTTQFGTYHFHLAKWARELYEIDDYLFQLNGNLILVNLFQTRLLINQMHLKKTIIPINPEKVTAGNLFGLGLIDEILHVVVGLYKKQINSEIMSELNQTILAYFKEDSVDDVFVKFIEDFPPLEIYRKTIEQDQYLKNQTDGQSNKDILIEEILMLWLTNQNKAFSAFEFLFDDQKLQQESIYKEIISHMDEFFKKQPTFGPQKLSLFELLQLPAKMEPNSIQAQLDWIMKEWGDFFELDEFFLKRLTLAKDILNEENYPRGFCGPGPAEVIDYSLFEDDIQMYSTDSNWMPRLVLIAKNSYVWLNQLSKKYQKEIRTLDQIPDEELKKLNSYGINGLWLIGLWERSKASQKIKQSMGDQDAVASAYSLNNYTIAHALGGPQALENLKERAKNYGIRLASDMVPNHMGIDSYWVEAHPDWFISLNYPPFASYSFNSQDLCENPAIGVYLEDHYYSKSDAAVVFKRLDHYTGDVKYIYHGNDGTSMPWNDTAQINFLNVNAKEAVIQTIISIAKQFPIIRFDAAMTLAKKHVQRLWFPEPGSAGAIPSRAEFGMTKAEFNKLMPEEFWREVVARVAQEAPDTLLLAEAFWMMEGFFVRNLGMHRVYNSAFMHMLRDEDNAKYRQLIKETLEYDPQILKRYVNFMNNPDEETAVEQFGKDDKYFGVCTLLATLPGLPMIGHGQLEGFSEKYGMEYHSAKKNETEDQWLLDRHKHQISPLFHQRYLFADVANFRLYDFYQSNGSVNENVFAISNRFADSKAIVIYHNRFADTHGTIKLSSAYLDINTEDTNLKQEELAYALDLSNLDASQDKFVIFKDIVTGLYFIHSLTKIRDEGLTLHLRAYQTHVFTEFKIVSDDENKRYSNLEKLLNGNGTPDIHRAIIQMIYKVVQEPFRELINAGFIDYVIGCPKSEKSYWKNLNNQYQEKVLKVNNAVIDFLNINLSLETQPAEIMSTYKNFENSLSFLKQSKQKKSQINSSYLDKITENKKDSYLFYQWILIHKIGSVVNRKNHALISRAWVEELNWQSVIEDCYLEIGENKSESRFYASLLKALLIIPAFDKTDSAEKIINIFFNDIELKKVLQINTYNEIQWFNKELSEKLVDFCLLISLYTDATQKKLTIKAMNEKIDFAKKMKSDFKKADYQVKKLNKIIEQKA